MRARLSRQSSTSSNVTALKYVDTGEVVKLHQDKIKRAGYAIDIGGSFGPVMEKVVRQFQADQGLVVDGYHGPASQAKLDEILIAMRNKPAPPNKEDDKMTYKKDAQPSASLAKQFNEAVQLKITDGHVSTTSRNP